MKLIQKSKIACASLLAVACIGTAAAGFALTGGGVQAGAAAKEKWDGFSGKAESIGEEVVTSPDSVAILNKSVDITQLPNSTGVFYMYYTNSITWSGFSLRNGNEANGYSWILDGASTTAFPWHTLAFEGTNSHMILQDNRVFTPNGTLGGLKGVEGETPMDGFVPVEIHIGEGQAKGDASYVKIGGVELTQQDDQSKPITLPWTRPAGSSKELTTAMFPDGAYLAINWNKSGADPLFAVTEPGSVVALNPSFTMKDTVKVGTFDKDLTLELSSGADVFADGCTVTAKVNGKAIAGGATLEKTDDNHATVKLTKEQLNAIPMNDYESITYFTFTFENGDTNYGTVVAGLKILFEDPPVLDKTELALPSKEAFEIKFDYEGICAPLEDLTVFHQATSSAPETELVKGDDFTVTKATDANTYTVAITTAGAGKIFDGHASSTVVLRMGKHVLRVPVFVEGQTTEYGIRFRDGIDYVGDKPSIDNFYASATLHKHDPALLSTRIFYENAVDVTKPIFIEYATLDPAIDWMLISLMSTPTISEYFAETTAPQEGNVTSFIMFGLGRNNMQGMNGTFENGNTTEHALNTSMKNNFVEIKLGETDPKEGYVKVNNEVVGGAVLTKTQQDYKDGRAWVGFFFNNKTDVKFTCNTHVNPVAITAPQADSAYKMDLGKATDFTVDITNTSGNLKITDETGKELPSSDWSYASGKLTVKASYFAGKTFAKDGQIFIWDTEKETGTGFKMAYSNSDMGVVNVGYAIKGALADTTFELGISSVDNIKQNGTDIATDLYSVADGKLTIKKEALKDEVGAQEFIVTSGGKLYPCFVYVNAWADSFALADGAARNGGTFTLTGNTNFMRAKTYDLSSGVKVGFDFKSIGKYYERKANADGTRFSVRFVDPFSGSKLYVTVFANFADDKISSANNALYVDYGVIDAEGVVHSDSDRAVTPTNGDTNPSASGAHELAFAMNGSKLQITVAGRPFTFKENIIEGFNLKACILEVTTEGTAEGSVAEVSLSDVDSAPATNNGGEEEEGGCGSVVFAGFGAGIALAILVAGTAAVLFLRKKRD